MKRLIISALTMLAWGAADAQIANVCPPDQSGTKDVRLKIRTANNTKAHDLVRLANGNTLVVFSSLSMLNPGLNLSMDILLGEVKPDGTMANQLAFGTSAEDVPRSVHVNSDGNYIVVGQSAATGSKDLVFYEISSSTWTVTRSWYYLGTNAESIRNCEQLSNGDFILSGHTKSYGGTDGDMIFVKVDKNGNDIWSLVINGVNDDENAHIVEGPSGELYFTGNTTSVSAGGTGPTNDHIVFGKISSAGVLQYMDVYYSTNSPAAGGHDIEYFNNHCYIVGVHNLNDGVVLKVNPSAPAGSRLVEKKHYGSGNSAKESFARIQIINNEIYVAGTIETFGNEDIYVMKIDSDCDVVWDKAFDISEGDEHLGEKSKMYIDNDVLWLCGYTAEFGVGINALLIAEDLTSSLGCPVKVPSFTAADQSYSELNPTIQPTGGGPATIYYDHCDLTPVPHTCTIAEAKDFSSFQITPTTVGIGSDFYCGSDFNEFVLRYGITNQDVRGRDMVQLNQYSYVVLASVRDQVAPGSGGDYALLWIDEKGNLLQTVFYGDVATDEVPRRVFYDATLDRLFVTGETNQDPLNGTTDMNLFFNAIDNSNANKNIINERIYDIDNNVDRISNTTQLASGQFIITGYTQWGSESDHVFIKVDNTGTPVWTSYASNASTGASTTDANAHVVETSSGHLYTTGNFRNTTNGTEDRALVRLDPTTGTPINSWVVDNSGTGEGGHDIGTYHDASTNTDFVYLVGVYNDGDRDGALSIFDATAGVFTAHLLFGDPNKAESFSKVNVLDDRIFIHGFSENEISPTSERDIWVMEIDPGGNELQTRYFGGEDRDIWDKSRFVQTTLDGGFYFCATSRSFNLASNFEALIFKTTFDIKNSCNSWCENVTPTLLVYQPYNPLPLPQHIMNHGMSNFAYLGQTETLVSACSPSGKHQIGESGLIVFEEPQLNIFPNPNNGVLTIFSEDFTGASVDIHIFNMVGATIYTRAVQQWSGELKLDVPSLLPGNYLIEMRSGDKVERGKMIVLE